MKKYIVIFTILLLGVLLIGILLTFKRSEKKEANLATKSTITCIQEQLTLKDCFLQSDLNTIHSTNLNSASLEDSILLSKIESHKLKKPKGGGGGGGGGAWKHFPKGGVYKIWVKLFKECINNQLFFNDSMLYLGVSNQLGIGALLMIGENNRIDPYYPSVIDSLNPAKYKNVVQKGTISSCSYQQKVKIGSELFVGATLAEGLGGDLNFYIMNSRDICGSVDNWEMDVIYIGMFCKILRESNNKDMNDFLLALIKPNVYLITKVVKVNGFSATIKTNTDISANLKIDLQSGIIKNIGNSNAQLKFTYVNDKTIKVTSLGDFIVFAEIKKFNENLVHINPQITE